MSDQGVRRKPNSVLDAILDLEVPIRTEWQSFDASAGSGWLTTSGGGDPTFGTEEENNAKWRRDGGDLLIKWDFRQSSAGNDVGSGVFLVNVDHVVPGATIDINRASGNGTTTPTTIWGFDSGLGYGFYTTDSPFAHYLHPNRFNATQIKFIHLFTGASQGSSIWNVGNSSFERPGLAISITLRIPITGWTEKQTIREQLGL